MPTSIDDFIRQRLPQISRPISKHENWAGKVSVTSGEIIRPENPDDIVNTIKYAERDTVHPKEISTFGSLWSYTNCAIDSSNQLHIDTSALNQVLAMSDLHGIGLLQYKSHIKSTIEASEPINTNKLVFVEAGIKIHELNCALDAKGLALHTLGGSSGQSLGGFVNTASHGAEQKLPPFVDAVRAIYLMSYGGETWWIEPSSTPITEQQAWNNDELNIIYDDDLFYAALVSFGCSGIVSAYVMETVGAFQLESVTTEEDWSQMALEVNTISRSSSSGDRYLEIIVTHDDKCRVIRRKKVGHKPTIDYQDRNNTVVDLSDPQAQIDKLNRCWGFSIFGWRLGRNEIDKQIKTTIDQIRPIGVFRHKSWIINTYQPDCPIVPKVHSPTEKKILSYEFIIDSRFAVEIINGLRRVLINQREGNRAIIVSINLRLTGASKALLAPQKDKKTAHLEIYLISGASGNRRFQDSMYALISTFNQRSLVNHFGIVKIRPHWGQLHDITRFNFLELYPELPKWRSCIERLKKGSQLSTFETKFATDRNLL